ncbi:acyl-CoA synthetase short-chain family member 3, mitochondrial [Arctopsyche grandis]|uniref:acyl-CoA synthetase short-chain family member 3, mitochondrial n=1 Tax=Arctopsyche grandis TaxID=121162 RepID=UPI00406D8765
MITSVKCDDGDMLEAQVNGDKNGTSKDVGMFEKQINRAKLDGRMDKFEGSTEFILDQNPYSSPKYEAAYKRSLEDPEGFWGDVGKSVVWSKPWDKVLDHTNPPFTKWYVGGELNACYNAVDRHVLAGRGDRTALIHDSPLTQVIRKVTYNQLLDQVSHIAGALASLGVNKGDSVLIYMPLIPEAVVSMLATARLGAVHSVVFGGFAARELCARIEHAQPKVIIAASCGVEPNKIVKYKDILNDALARSSHLPNKCIIFQRHKTHTCKLEPDIDVDWNEAIKTDPHMCVPVEANEPLYILYTSGTTDKPKGIQRPTGGHIATLTWTMSNIYGIKDTDVWWAASDLGWVVGHSYICYGPLLFGITCVMYEGKPDRTPDPGQYFRIIHQHQVNAIFTIPTAFRVIRREDPEMRFGRKYSTKSLRNVFVAGEHCDDETKTWAERVFKVPILNHWWQTETGHAITATCLGLVPMKMPAPKFSAGMPVPGYNIQVLRADGSNAKPNELGRIAIKLPLPPGTASTLFKADDRFRQVYFSRFDGYYDTMDAGYADEFGHIYVTARDDDVINVAGHRLSTSAIEDVVLAHPDVCDASVMGVPEPTKGEIPLCLFVMRANANKNESEITNDLIKMVRELIGPIASFNKAAAVAGLPRTRSGKTLRKSIADLSRNKLVQLPGTIEDPSVYKDIKRVLRELGYAKNAPDPLL